jgi:hypothetical protein
MKGPRKKGDYVLIIQGELKTWWPCSTDRQAHRAAAALTAVGRRSAAIDHWDGFEWTDTGLVLDAL